MLAERTTERLASEAPAGAEESRGERAGDLLLTAALLGVFLLPLVCDRLAIGEWGSGTLGLGTAGAVVAARALWSVLRERAGRPSAAIRALPRA